MLESLYIENIAVIDKAELRLGAGLTCLTGETGAGKSIVIDSIRAVLGERTGREIIRTGARSAQVTALFSALNTKAAAKLEELGLSAGEDGELLLQRSVNIEGKSVFRVNTIPVTAAVLRLLGAALVNIHGQHDNHALLNPEKHVTFLDAAAGNTVLLAEYKKAYAARKKLLREQEALQMDEREKARRLELLDFQIDELSAVKIRIGEQGELRAQLELLRNAEKIADELRGAKELLTNDEDGGAAALLNAALRRLESAEEYLPELAEAIQTVRDAAYTLPDAAGEIRSALENLDCDPRELESAEERLDLLHRLERKYGAEDERALLDALDEANAERARISSAQERLDELAAHAAHAEAEVLRLAERLSTARKAAAHGFEDAVLGELRFLDMPNAQFEVHFNPCAPMDNGTEKAEFLLSANAGEAVKPLVKIASGGELSRIMLALKNALPDTDGVDTLIFDEVDAGIGGRAARKVGAKLRAAANGRQVLCVTHLAQIAAQGDSQLYIKKETRDGKTFTAVTPLEREGRISELARMLGGLEETVAQRAAAEELMDN
ncbi:MAG: DNA repair protein RecN [Oscillospiraceae bacterium]|jgi:DNA repair protein RecN (Recombination protein N)|nr:DNA repair protein RecN [Oscillospiraceae bacterium]